jgi:hypothetical protein
MDGYLSGTDVLGADFFDMGPLPEQFVVVRVKNLPALVKAQGGAAGSLAMDFAPRTIANEVYSKIQGEFKKALSEKGVDADVTVTATPPQGAAPQGEFLIGIGIGAGAATLVGLLLSVLKK